MKKLLILTMMCALFGSMVALESDPSEVVGYVKYECVLNANGNYAPIALALDAGYTTASELDSDYPDISSLGVWNAATQQWDVGVDYGGGFWFPDPALSPNQPVLITVDQGIDIYFAGGLNPDPSYTLTVNINGNYTPIMLPLDSDITLASELDTEVSEVNSVGAWNSTNMAWDVGVDYGGGFWFPDTPMSPGKVYLLTVDSEVVWPNPSSDGLKSQNKRN